jgi:hypothetical protein
MSVKIFHGHVGFLVHRQRNPPGRRPGRHSISQAEQAAMTGQRKPARRDTNRIEGKFEPVKPALQTFQVDVIRELQRTSD